MEDLYQDLIIEHSKSPVNFRKLTGDCQHITLHNPLCGDCVDLYVRLLDGKIVDCSFEGSGCSISKAAASILSEEVKGKTISHALSLISAYRALLTCHEQEDMAGSSACCSSSEQCVDSSNAEDVDIGDLVVFGGVRNYPTRVRCATLAVEALFAILNRKESVT